MKSIEERNIVIQSMLEDCIGWDSEVSALREAFSRGEEFHKKHTVDKQVLREYFARKKKRYKSKDDVGLIEIFEKELGLDEE